jgi:hypothetical protein
VLTLASLVVQALDTADFQFRGRVREIIVQGSSPERIGRQSSGPPSTKRILAMGDSRTSVATTISDVIGTVLTEHKLFIVKPQHPTMGEIALEAYGFGKACDAVAIQGDELQALLLEIGTRCSETLKDRT